MDNARQIRNLALVGFMGTGKSSVGRLVADVLHFTFLDTDDVIKARAGMSIAEIFEHQGEPAFRDWERRIVDELTRRHRTVIATGGSAEKLAAMRAVGADYVINRHEEDAGARVAELFPAGVDLALDYVGPETLATTMAISYRKIVSRDRLSNTRRPELMPSEQQ